MVGLTSNSDHSFQKPSVETSTPMLADRHKTNVASTSKHGLTPRDGRKKDETVGEHTHILFYLWQLLRKQKCCTLLASPRQVIGCVILRQLIPQHLTGSSMMISTLSHGCGMTVAFIGSEASLGQESQR